MGFDNATIARRYMTEIWVYAKMSSVDDLVADDFVQKEPGFPDTIGKQALKAKLKDIGKTFSDNTIVIEELIVAGDRVVIRHTWRGKHVGDFSGVKATGRLVSCPAIEVLRIKSGKVVENISYYDQYTMFQQLGVLPPPDKLASSTLASKHLRA